MRYLPLALSLALIAGIAAGVGILAPSPLSASLTLSAAWTAALFAYRHGLSRLHLVAVLALLVVAGCLLGANAIDAALHAPIRTLLEQRAGGFAIEAADEPSLPEPVVIEGRLLDDAAIDESGVTVRVGVESVVVDGQRYATAGGVAIGVGGALQPRFVPAWTAGRRVRLSALLRRPARYLNDGLADQERDLARRGVALVGSVKSAQLVQVLSRGRWWEEAAAGVRRHTRSALARHVRSGEAPANAIAAAILIGDRSGLDAETERQLQQAGTYHVIAISGGNIAILAGLMLSGFGWLGLRGRLAALATLAVLAGYAIVASGGASVARATLTAGVYLAVRLIDHRMRPANVVAVTAAIILLASPLAIADVGFWLTFGATMAILVGLSRVRLPQTAVVRAGAAVFVSSCFVELALAPIGAFVFQRVTAAGLLLNFAALPAMTVVQLAAMALVGCDAIGLATPADWLGHLVEIASAVLTGTARWVDLAPWSAWRVPSPHPAIVAAYYLAAILALTIVARSPRVPASRNPGERHSRSGIPAAAVAAALFVWIVAAPQARAASRGDGSLHLTMIDVGQGDAMLMTFPNGRHLVVDSGGAAPGSAFDIGDRVVGPVLRARGVLTFDYLAITHGDPDHIGGARALVRDFAPREVWWGVPVANHQPMAALHTEADRIGSAWRTLQRGDRVELGGVELRVHHPPSPEWERQRTRNDDSLVLELRYGDVSMLLTGDIGKDVERQLLSVDLLPVVVLKVAHHGSATSSVAEFVEHVRPKVAVIGVGRGNPYGHPVPAVVERLRAVGAAVFRTDQEGEIEVVTDGKHVAVQTWMGRRGKW